MHVNHTYPIFKLRGGKSSSIVMRPGNMPVIAGNRAASSNVNGNFNDLFVSLLGSNTPFMYRPQVQSQQIYLMTPSSEVLSQIVSFTGQRAENNYPKLLLTSRVVKGKMTLSVFRCALFLRDPNRAAWRRTEEGCRAVQSTGSGCAGGDPSALFPGNGTGRGDRPGGRIFR